jgi:hypothetical protein
VDTRELLGPPLTEHIDTFLSVGGSNYGSILCLVPIPIGTCNKKNGLHCESEFLADVNAQTGYEGAQIFSIFSTDDEKVGNDFIHFDFIHSILDWLSDMFPVGIPNCGRHWFCEEARPFT